MRKALDNRSLANARFTDKRRVVLLATAKNLDQAFDFRFTPDNRVEFTCTRHRGEVTTEVVENRSLGAGTATRVALRLERTLDIVGLFGGNAIVATVLELVQHLLEILERHVERGERCRSRGIRLLQDGKHQMFRTDVLVSFHLGNLGRIEKDRLGLGRKREQASTGIAAHGHNAAIVRQVLLDRLGQVVQVHLQGLQGLGSKAGFLAHQPEKQMLDGNAVTTEIACSHAGRLHYRLGLSRKDSISVRHTHSYSIL